MCVHTVSSLFKNKPCRNVKPMAFHVMAFIFSFIFSLYIIQVPVSLLHVNSKAGCPLEQPFCSRTHALITISSLTYWGLTLPGLGTSF